MADFSTDADILDPPPASKPEDGYECTATSLLLLVVASEDVRVTVSDGPNDTVRLGVDPGRSSAISCTDQRVCYTTEQTLAE